MLLAGSIVLSLSSACEYVLLHVAVDRIRGSEVIRVELGVLQSGIQAL